MRLGNDFLSFELDAGSALDVGSCKVDGVELSPGKAVPDDGDPRILHAVSGFLFTCGPDHIRHPEPVEGRDGARYPLHGSISGHAPEILQSTDENGMQTVIARIEVTFRNGGVADVQRVWSFDTKTGEAMVEDKVTNSGAQAFPPMLMYHMNIGAHLFDGNTRLKGASFDNGDIGWRFGEGEGLVFCVPAASEDGRAHVALGPIAAIGGKSLHVWFDTDTLPHLQMWRNQAGHCDVLGIEPVSHPWKGRKELEGEGLMPLLQPGESRSYRLGFSFR